MTPSKETVLLPCPFCGGVAKVVKWKQHGRSHYTANCTVCDATATDEVYEDNASLKWNMRATAAPPATTALEWQPIESAPRDGTQILAYDGSDCMCVEYVRGEDDFAGWEMMHTQTSVYICAKQLTHWMPLPSPPASFIAAKEGEG